MNNQNCKNNSTSESENSVEYVNDDSSIIQDDDSQVRHLKYFI